MMRTKRLRSPPKMAPANCAPLNAHGLKQQLELLALLSLVIIFVVACGGSKTEKSMPPEGLKPEDYPTLERRLFELSVAKEPAEYAKGHELDYVDEDEKVRVIIELKGEAESVVWGVEALDGRVETQHEGLVQALVPVRALLSLAKHPQVVFIRPPVKPERDR